MAFNRASIRNVFFYDSRRPDALLGGLFVEPSVPSPVTVRTFREMLEIVLLVPGTYSLCRADKSLVVDDAAILLPGNYYIHVSETDVDVLTNDEPVLVRSISLGSGTRTRAFADAVRARDGACVVTHQAVPGCYFRGFQAAHIFPLAYEKQWKDAGLSRWVRLSATSPSPPGGTINAVQNGLLMRSDMHALFDDLAFSINPDDNYKIVWFLNAYDHGSTTGTLLPRTLQDPQRRPADALLRWHFRQAVLANMRGAADYPSFEHDFPPGSDILGDIRAGPRAAERMEAELFGRMARDLNLVEGEQVEVEGEGELGKKAKDGGGGAPG